MDGWLADFFKELTSADEFFLSKCAFLILEDNKQLTIFLNNTGKKVYNPHGLMLSTHRLAKHSTNIGFNRIVFFHMNGETLLGIAGLFEQLNMLLEVNLVMAYRCGFVAD